jgi:hypothetical protein
VTGFPETTGLGITVKERVGRRSVVEAAAVLRALAVAVFTVPVMGSLFTPW